MNPRSITKALFLASATLLTTLASVQADPSGTWTWAMTLRNGGTMTNTLKLKVEGEKLSGFVVGRNGNETAIQNAKVNGDEVSFQVTREFNGNSFTSQYKGKVTGDSLKGTISSERDGQTRSRDWEAKRQGGSADAKSSKLTGNWKYSFTTPGGQTLEPTLKLKQNGDQLTGTIAVMDRESDISEGKVNGDQVSFRVVRERDGRSFTSKYEGKLQGDVIKGKVTSNWGGNERSYDFEAKREN